MEPLHSIDWPHKSLHWAEWEAAYHIFFSSQAGAWTQQVSGGMITGGCDENKMGLRLVV